MAKVEFHFDFGSPNAYLAHVVIPQIERRTGAKFQYVPVLLSSIVASGGLLVDQAMAAMLRPGSVSALVFANRFVSVALNASSCRF